MKTIKTSLFTLAIVLIASATFAAGNLKVNMTKADANTAVVAATNLKAELFEIKLSDSFGDVIFSKETEATSDYFKRYDFSLLDNGTYYLEVKHGEEKYQKQFVLENGEVEVTDIRKTLKPHFAFADNTFKMSFLNFNDDKMGLYVYDDNTLLFEKKIASDFSVNEGLGLSSLEPGDYTIVFTAGIDIYEHEVTVK
jgi:hypothetical protein